MTNRLITSVLALLIWNTAFALPSIQDEFIHVYPQLKSKKLNNCSTCHMPNISKGLNRFGLDLKAKNINFVLIEKIDSDKDGINNITEINNDEFPGSKNSSGGHVFKYENNRNNVHFNHQAHMTIKSYGKKFNCMSCHHSTGFKKEFGGTKNMHQKAHNLCLDCHTKKSPNSTKAAIKCSSCHKDK